MPLKKMVFTLMPQKVPQAHVCHALNFCLRTCHFGWILLEFNTCTSLTYGTHGWKLHFCPRVI
jgi:hypothetical protein